MSTRDRFREIVKEGLKKEGWNITHDPFPLKAEGLTDMDVDLGAEKIIAAQKENRKIAVEVKSFLRTSTISKLHTAIGQYINYRYRRSPIFQGKQLQY